MPTILVSNIPPNRITGEPREIGAPALKVTYSPIVTPLNANPIPILAKIPESWACCGMSRAHCHSTQASPVEKVQQPYININRLLEILFAASFTHRSAAANAHAVTTAYFIQPIIQICPLVVNATDTYCRLIKISCPLPPVSTKEYLKTPITSSSEVRYNLSQDLRKFSTWSEFFSFYPLRTPLTLIRGVTGGLMNQLRKPYYNIMQSTRKNP